jgi:hypothetical protein
LPLFERKLASASPDSLAHSAHHFAQPGDRSRLNLQAETAVCTLQEALKTDNMAAFRQGVRELAGLGMGLTPAGDDFLLGVSYGLWLTRESTQTQKFMAVLRAEAVARTTTLSGAWLEAAARGEAGQAWHELVQALALTSTSSVNAVSDAIDHILGIGHTSGADALAGFVMTIAIP